MIMQWMSYDYEKIYVKYLSRSIIQLRMLFRQQVYPMLIGNVKCLNPLWAFVLSTLGNTLTPRGVVTGQFNLFIYLSVYVTLDKN